MYPFLYLGDFKLPMYGVMIATGVVVALIFAVLDCKRKELQPNYMLAIIAPALLVGMVGAKIFYLVITYTSSELLYILKYGDFEQIISGGYVFYGGFVIGILSAIGMSKILKCKFSDYENVLVKCIPLAYAFGRIGCFFAGCCYGLPTDSFLGIAFEHPLGSAPNGIPLIPIQLFECAFNLLLTAFLWLWDTKHPQNKLLVPFYLIIYSLERFIFEFFRYDIERGIWMGFSTSQWISIVVFVAGIMYLGYKKKSVPKALFAKFDE